jgi:hypothetical protein
MDKLGTSPADQMGANFEALFAKSKQTTDQKKEVRTPRKTKQCHKTLTLFGRISSCACVDAAALLAGCFAGLLVTHVLIVLHSFTFTRSNVA